MKPYKKTKIARTTIYRKEYKVESRDLKERYCDEGVTFYPLYRKGFKNPNKTIMSYQVRMYKTWKHNRIKQYRNENTK
jgi:hypothetical protein